MSNQCPIYLKLIKINLFKKIFLSCLSDSNEQPELRITAVTTALHFLLL